MFLRVGLQAENNVLDRMPYHFSGLKGVKMTDLASLKLQNVPILNELCHEKTCFLHMQKQQCRSAEQFSLHRTIIRNFMPLAISCGCIASKICVRNPEDPFSQDTTHL